MIFRLILICCTVSSILCQEVIVIGGGVSGLTSAHELIERGFSVNVYDRQDVFGGKARSYDVAGTGLHQRLDLPGEHGFRIFWNYYVNMFDTLKRIKYNESCSVWDNMREIHANALLTESGPEMFLNFGPNGIKAVLEELRNVSELNHILDKYELDFAIERTEVMFTTCDERMREEFEHYTFAQFVGAQYRSENFTKWILGLLHLGGINPNAANLGATVNFLKSQNAPWDEDMHIMVLQGPTNEQWIDPWVQQLSTGNSQFYLNKVAQTFSCSNGTIQSINFLDTITGKIINVMGDYFVLAVPVDEMLLIMKRSMEADPACAKLSPIVNMASKLNTTWMVGMQYYLHKDVPVTDGMQIYLDSPWEVTAVSYKQWWPGYPWNNSGDGTENGVLSAIISNFTAPGILYNKTAAECSVEEIQNEVWAQIKAHLNRNGPVLTDDNLAAFSLDTSLQYVNGTLSDNEPLFFSTPNSWANSPSSITPFSNLFLCGDYVQALTRTTPSTMEAANETGRRAVNALLIAAKSKATPCDVLPPPRNPDYAPFCAEDLARFKLGLTHTGCTQRGCVATS